MFNAKDIIISELKKIALNPQLLATTVGKEIYKKWQKICQKERCTKIKTFMFVYEQEVFVETIGEGESGNFHETTSIKEFLGEFIEKDAKNILRQFGEQFENISVSGIVNDYFLKIMLDTISNNQDNYVILFTPDIENSNVFLYGFLVSENDVFTPFNRADGTNRVEFSEFMPSLDYFEEHFKGVIL